METPPLNYATPDAPDASRPRHPRAVTILMLVGVIVFFGVGLWGLVCMDILGAPATLLMLAAALMYMIVVFGFLSSPRPQFTAGAIMTFGAFLAVGVATLLTHGATLQLEREIIARRGNGIGGVLVVYAESDAGKSLGTLQAARVFNAGGTFLAFCLLVYLVVRSLHRRPTWA